VGTAGQLQNLDWYGTRSNSTQFTPEKRLALAILVDALRQIFHHSPECNEAFDWLMGVRGYGEDSSVFGRKRMRRAQGRPRGRAAPLTLVACNSDIGIGFMYHEAWLKVSFA